MSCDSEETARPYEEHSDDGEEESASAETQGHPRVVAEADDDEEDLEEYEADAYLCRWPNGDFSIRECFVETAGDLELGNGRAHIGAKCIPWIRSKPTLGSPTSAKSCSMSLAHAPDEALYHRGPHVQRAPLPLRVRVARDKTTMARMVNDLIEAYLKTPKSGT